MLNILNALILVWITFGIIAFTLPKPMTEKNLKKTAAVIAASIVKDYLDDMGILTSVFDVFGYLRDEVTDPKWWEKNFSFEEMMHLGDIHAAMQKVLDDASSFQDLPLNFRRNKQITKLAIYDDPEMAIFAALNKKDEKSLKRELLRDYRALYKTTKGSPNTDKYKNVSMRSSLLELANAKAAASDELEIKKEIEKLPIQSERPGE